MHTFGGKADNWQDIILLELSSSPCVLRNEALVPSGYVPAGHRMSPSFHRLFFFLAKHNQAETGFKKKLLSDEGRELYHFLLCWVDVQICKNTMARHGNSFLKHWIYI